MTKARPVLPTDLLALVSYNGRSYQNQAWTRERVGSSEPSQPTLGLLLDQFLGFTRGRSAWISVRRQRLQGLVGVRGRGGRQAWEIDYLIDATPKMEAVGGLLECAISEVGRSGAEKLFLRLPADSDLMEVVRGVGFLPYQEEVLYGRQPAPLQTTGPDLRHLTPSDSYAVFRLYNATRPEATRRSEAATFGEWHASQERVWLKQGAQLLYERDGELAAYVRVARLDSGISVDLLADDKATAEAPAIIDAAARDVEAEPTAPVFVLVPRAAEGLARRLEDAGYTPRGEFVSLMRRTTRLQVLPKMLPAIAETMRA